MKQSDAGDRGWHERFARFLLRAEALLFQTSRRRPEREPAYRTQRQIPGGDLGIWSSTDSSGNRACAAAELNDLLSSDADKTPFVLAVAAGVQ